MLDELLRVLAKDPNLTNAVATVVTAVVALAALFVSAVSLFVGWTTLRHQRTHNVLSVRPIPTVTTADHEDFLRIRLRNHGSGPLIVTDRSVSNRNHVEKTLIEWMPDLPDDLLWANFAGRIKNRSLLPGGEITLLELNGDFRNAAVVAARNSVRTALSRLTVTIRYTDIYNSQFASHSQDLAWFGRQDSGQDET